MRGSPKSTDGAVHIHALLGEYYISRNLTQRGLKRKTGISQIKLVVPELSARCAFVVILFTEMSVKPVCLKKPILTII